MIKIMLINTTIMNSILFLITKHPLSMGLVMLFQTLLICLTTSLSAKNFWFSYILFLIFLGGMLILFIYVISLASNEMFNFSMNLMVKLMTMLLIISLLMYFSIDLFMLNNFNLNMETTMNENMMFMNMENSQLLNKLFNFPTNMITILLMIYLFLCLIAVCKIINIFEGPLRPKF
uniref:NADH-ubiquinone oxidoreductase chain 6 n=1 Tax=Thienemanniella triangula TaxID=3072306 RepID=A0AA51QUF3_9DIPT|nr:NADH dehydrogenase subunit 6 [Thienemanniella triangula]WML69340.1 NADH dehydrogenase subunit 6 [Thienemanniella triangula]